MSEVAAKKDQQSPRPFEIDRERMYTTFELLEGYNAREPLSLAQSLDYRIYQYWVVKGRFKPQRLEGMLQCLHDSSITNALAKFIAGRRVVGIMGGHDVSRDSSAFSQVSTLARLITQKGFLVATGGGPGLMEAANFGSLFARENDLNFRDAQKILAAEPSFPFEAGNVVNRRGEVDEEAVLRIAEWFSTALRARRSVTSPCESLGIPTWRYGHEPSTIFATHIAKYFENSVREDGLLSIANSGIIYAQGGAGTLQEVFQSAVFNAYTDVDRGPSPMIFLGNAFWEKSGALQVLKGVFGQHAFEKYVTCTDDIEDAVNALETFARRDPSQDRHAIKRGSPSLPCLGAPTQVSEDEIGPAINFDVC